VTERHRNEVFTALAHQRRRATISVLQRLDRPTLEELAVHLVTAETGKSLLDVTEDETARMKMTLKHVHLPQLAELDLLTREDGRVRTTQHPALQDPKMTEIIETDAPEWDTVLTALADKRRRIILSILSMNETPMCRDELARQVARIAERDSDGVVSVERMCQQLHHRHLPELEDATLVTYDIDAETVTYDGHPDLDEEWLVADRDDTPRSILSMAHQSGDIWTLEGRDNVTERGRALCESADEELFMMFTVEGTVETACFRRIQDALDRDVDVYLGTQNAQLRDLVRTRAPEVTIWEPQLDWLNLPPDHEKVGRLIMADREEILVGTIGEADAQGMPHETAITGSGSDNPLVMLLREMLGSRLDHLDAQSEDFLSQIPL
jgi:DNA-binding transcriptional ArsR family regulator